MFTINATEYPLYNPLIPEVFHKLIKAVTNLDSWISLFTVWQASLVLTTSKGKVIVIAFNPVSAPHKKVYFKLFVLSLFPLIKRFL